MIDKNFISLDLEYNQPSGTIIQVGLVVGNLKTGDILEKYCKCVKVDEIISDYIINLTGVTQLDVDNGSKLQDIYNDIVDLSKKYDCFRNPITWGGGDSIDLRNELKLTDQDFIFGRRWIDAKTLFVSRCFARELKHQSGLGKSMKRLGLSFEGRKHNALDDALNTFIIYRKLLEDINI